MTVLLAAGGYVINDWFDVNTDLKNKSAKTIVTNTIDKKHAIVYYILLNLTAFIISLSIYFSTGVFNVLWICVGCFIMLFLYSQYLKSTLLIGNIIVSFFLCMVPFLFFFMETSAISILRTETISEFRHLIFILFSFVIFAFLSNLIREIIKDCEDMEGDKSTGLNTFATNKGLKKTDQLNIALTIILFLASLIWLVQFQLWKTIIEFTIFVLLVIFPILFVFWKLQNPQRIKAKYSFLSKQLKITMALGILYLFIHLNF